MIGPLFRVTAGVIANLTDQDLSVEDLLLGGKFVLPESGKLVGFVREQGAVAITAGTLTIAAVVNGTNGDLLALTSGSRGSHIFAEPVLLTAGDDLGFQFSTDISYVGATLLGVWPILVLNR